MYGDYSQITMSSYPDMSSTSGLLSNTLSEMEGMSSGMMLQSEEMLGDLLNTAVGGALTGAVMGVLLFAVLFSMVMSILSIIANWKIFSKAGEKGWKSLIPIYNTIVLFRIAGLSPALILVYFAGALPVIGGIVVLGLTVFLMYKLSVAFGKGAGFTVGLVLLNSIFMMILGFGKAQYCLKKDEIVVNSEE